MLICRARGECLFFLLGEPSSKLQVHARATEECAAARFRLDSKIAVFRKRIRHCRNVDRRWKPMLSRVSNWCVNEIGESVALATGECKTLISSDLGLLKEPARSKIVFRSSYLFSSNVTNSI